MMHIKLGDFSGEVLLPAKLYSLKKGKVHVLVQWYVLSQQPSSAIDCQVIS